MAHFLEHLVFKGGEKYPTYRDVNETAERMGASLNAYTSHDLVAFHITARAEARAAGDRPADRLRRAPADRRRGARPRARRRDPGDRPRATTSPPSVAEHLIDEAAFGDHPLGRPVLGPGGAPAHVHARRHRRLPRAPLGRRARRRVRRRQPGRGGRQRRGRRAVRALSQLPTPGALRARAAARAADPASSARDSNQSHLRMSYRPDDRRVAISAQRAALTIYATLLGGSMGSRLFDEIREQRGLAYSVYALDHAFADVAVLQLSAGLESGKCGRGLPTHAARSSTSCAPTGPTEEEVERARAYAAGRRVLAFENTNAVARYAAHADDRVRRGDRPRRGDRAPRRRSPTTRSPRSRAGISEELAVACVGPHDEEEFAPRA